MKKAKLPKISFRDPDSLQDYYQNGNKRWSVARLVDAAKDLEPFDLPIAGVDLSGEIWRDSNIFMLAFHVKRCIDADLSKPIILDWDGAIADGRHRLIRALVEGRRTIKAVRITWTMVPCKVIDE